MIIRSESGERQGSPRDTVCVCKHCSVCVCVCVISFGQMRDEQIGSYLSRE